MMKRSEINAAVTQAAQAFAEHDWILPPEPRWDVTDFGLGDFSACGLVLVNLAEQPEYCEKLMYVRHKQVTPVHCHGTKKEDIICRWGRLAVRLVSDRSSEPIQVNGKLRDQPAGVALVLNAGERVTLIPGQRHEFWSETDYCIVGEVSTANDDQTDNLFDNSEIGRFGDIEEDEPALVELVSD